MSTSKAEYHLLPTIEPNPDEKSTSVARGPNTPTASISIPNTSTSESSSGNASFFFWIAVNCVSTLLIVLVNKQVLSNAALRGAPTLFVAYHFFLTALTLHLASSSQIKAFDRKDSPILALLPLAIVFAAHTVVTNWSLALLEVAIYQELRILVTPATVAINFIFYHKTISLHSGVALGVVCIGIALTVYSDTLQKAAIASAKALEAGALSPTTSNSSPILMARGIEALHDMKNTPIGYFFGIAGVLLSALYTIWMAVYLKKLQMSSMQLLHKQAPLGCALLMLAAPLLDTFPNWGAITLWEWSLLFISGLCAVLINISQFFIVAKSSALSSTVVGHGKTCLVVAVGWMTATSAISLGSGLGILIAIIGIFSYSGITMTEKK